MSDMDNNPRKRIENLGTYEMIWDCSFCGTAAMPAKTHRFCVNCGAAQNADARRFPADDDKVAVANYEGKGADVICNACRTPNASDARFCRQCGAALTDAARVKTLGDQVRDEDATFEAMAQRDASREQFSADLQAAGVTPSTDNKGGGGIGRWIGIGLIVLLIAGGLFLILGQREETAVATGFVWERSIAVESFSAVPSAVWCDAMPLDAYSVRRETRVRETRRVPDGGESCQTRRTDNGDGTFSERRECVPTYRDEPIYADYCSFIINRWTPARVVESSGSREEPVTWPSLELRTGAGLGSERESRRDERYMIRLQVGDRQVNCPVAVDLWQATGIETAFRLQVNAATGAPLCNTLERVG